MITQEMVNNATQKLIEKLTVYSTENPDLVVLETNKSTTKEGLAMYSDKILAYKRIGKTGVFITVMAEPVGTE